MQHRLHPALCILILCSWLHALSAQAVEFKDLPKPGPTVGPIKPLPKKPPPPKKADWGLYFSLSQNIYGSSIQAVMPENYSELPLSTGTAGLGGSSIGVGVSIPINSSWSLFAEYMNSSRQTPVAFAGGRATGAWVQQQSSGSTSFLGPFEQSVNYYVSANQYRAGLRYNLISDSFFKLWLGAGGGLAMCRVSYENSDQSTEYGSASGSVPIYFGIMGFDYFVVDGFSISPIFEFSNEGSPSNFRVDNLFRQGWSWSAQTPGYGANDFTSKLKIGVQMVLWL